MIQAIKRRLIKAITKIYDPLVNLNIGTQVIKVPLSHQLRRNMEIYPDYNFNLPRIIKYINAAQPDLHVIDIGANIGDTVAFIKNYTDVPILCIDGEKKYLEILRANVAQYNNISVCQALVGAETKESNIHLKMERGTAFVEASSTTTSVRTLEDILAEFPDFRAAKVLKIDTDGFDTLILRGCSKYLNDTHPIIFLEFDPYLIAKVNDDPFQFISYLRSCGYGYLMFYVNNGDFLVSCTIEQTDLIDQLVHYFSGRNIAMFTDICAFAEADKALFDTCVAEEIRHFRKARQY